MSLPEEAGAAVSSRDTGLAFLIKADFASGSKRVWTGFGNLVTPDGQQWQGAGELLSIDGLSAALNGAAPAGTIGLSGLTQVGYVALAKSDPSEYLQRPISVFLQPFMNRALFGPICPIAFRIMTSMDVTRNAGTRTIKINHESPYVVRNNPANGWYSDRDQQSRHPGDRFCERVYMTLNKIDAWPDY